MSTLTVILATVSVLVVAQLLLKTGMSRAAVNTGSDSSLPALARAAVNRRVIAGGALYVAAAAAWLWVLSRVELTYAFPFFGLGYAGVVLSAVLLLHERPARLQWLGIGFVVAGVMMVAMSG